MGCLLVTGDDVFRQCGSLGKLGLITIFILWVNTWIEIATPRRSCYHPVQHISRSATCSTYLPRSWCYTPPSLSQVRRKRQKSYTLDLLRQAEVLSLPAGGACPGGAAVPPGERAMGVGQQTAEHQRQWERDRSDLFRDLAETARTCSYTGGTGRIQLGKGRLPW